MPKFIQEYGQQALNRRFSRMDELKETSGNQVTVCEPALTDDMDDFQRVRDDIARGILQLLKQVEQ